MPLPETQRAAAAATTAAHAPRRGQGRRQCLAGVPRTTWVFAALASLLFVLAHPVLLSAAPPDESFQARVEALRAGFETELATLASRCDELGLKEEAAITRSWQPRARGDRLILFLPTPGDLAMPPADAASPVRFWHRHFRAARNKHAADLWALALEMEAANAARAYQLWHEVLRHDPDHEAARAALGFVSGEHGWRPRGPAPAARTSSTPHPLFHWKPRRYWRIETAHFRIGTNVSAEAGLELGEQLETLHAAWRQLFFDRWSSPAQLARWRSGGTGPEGPRRRFDVVLFATREEYVARLREAAPNIELSEGIYIPAEKTSYFFASERSPTATWIHEATHQLFHECGTAAARDAAEAADAWIVEGIAMYMESLAIHNGYAVLGGCYANRLQFARYRLLNQQQYAPLRELAALGRAPLQAHPQVRELYSQAAGLAHFFMHAENGKYRGALAAYLDEVYAGKPGERRLEAAAGESLEELDAKYSHFLQVADDDLLHGLPDDVLRLCLGRTSVTDRGLAALNHQHSLVWLDLAYLNVSDAGLARLGELPHLVQLNLEGVDITPEGLAPVGGFAKLEELDLSQTRINDASLAVLKSLPELKTLWLTGCPLTDAAIPHLAELKSLESLDLSGTQITPEGRERLRKALPRWKSRDD